MKGFNLKGFWDVSCGGELSLGSSMFAKERTLESDGAASIVSVKLLFSDTPLIKL